jgi:serine phosphatase RsbU (regulator of sigma subunit)
VKPDRTRLIRWVGTLLAAATAAAMGYRAAQLPHEPYFGMSQRGAEVALVIPGGPADLADVRNGDRILAINGARIESIGNLQAVLREGGPGRPVSFRILRDNAIIGRILYPQRLPLNETVWQLSLALVAIATLLVGAGVFYRRAGRLTTVFFGICFALSMLLFRPSIFHGSWADWIDVKGIDLFSAFLPGLLVHFFLLFPYERARLRRHPRLNLLPYVPAVLLFAAAQLQHETLIRLGAEPKRVESWIGTLTALYGLAALVVSVLLFAQAYRSSPLPTIRRKLKVTLAGTLLGLVPLLVVMGMHTARPDLHVPLDRLANVMIFFLPASFGYAILRHGIFEIEFIVQRSLVYSAITAIVILAYFLAYFLLHALLRNVSGVGDHIGTLLAVAFVILLMSPVRGWWQERLDRWIYPDRYDFSRALVETSTLLRQAGDSEGTEKAILQAVRALLRVDTAAIFLRAADEENYRASMICGDGRMRSAGANGGEELSLGGFLADPLFRVGQPVSRGDLEGELAYGFLPKGDLGTLHRLQARAFVPLASGTRRIGILVLGTRRFGEPYSAPDFELLIGLQTQAVLALENALFARESAGQADLQRELQVARSIQQQLLPRRIPELPAIEIAASNVPCREIGGDYYDFLQTEAADLTLAIGDVSGKGVPAALLMANVQATFRAEASAGRPPQEVLAEMNRRLCTIDAPERFVSFFCGRLDLNRLQFAYANAGHLQPMLIRGDGRVERLDRGGLLLGITREASYEAGEVPLRPGDLLLLYTDGVVERGGPELLFGEGDLESIAARHRRLSATDLMGRILEELGRVGGPGPDDDTTLLILKAL